MATTVVNPLTESLWDEWVASHHRVTIFHTSAWARVLADTYGHEPCYLQLVGNEGPRALVPLMEVRSRVTGTRGVCLPFSDFCPPLILNSGGLEETIAALRDIAEERRWNYFEVRDTSILHPVIRAAESYYGHTLDLSGGIDRVVAGFTSAGQRALRKAERSGAVAEIRTDENAMAEFYQLHVKTRRRHGLPPQPRLFFRNIHSHIIDRGLGFIVLVNYRCETVAAAIFLQFARCAIYKFGASDPRGQHLRPNNLVIFAAIRRLTDSACKTLHFGRTDKHNEGLRRFKLSFGASETEICYGKFSVLRDAWIGTHKHRHTLHEHLFRALPVSVNRLAGALLYPHLD